MKATDFTLAWMQKFDFDGHQYKFSKIDVDSLSNITSSLFSMFDNYTSAQKNNVMVVLSDSVINYGTNYSSYVFQEGEILYLSSILNKLNTSTIPLCFGFLRQSLGVNIGMTATEMKYQFSQLAGTLYIFDFNDNPV